MNEEIARILGLLEEGKISATDAERLIRALREPDRGNEGAHSCPAPPPDLCHELQVKMRTLRRAVRQARDRQQRYAARYVTWCAYHLKRKAEQERRSRAERETTKDRVVHILLSGAMVGVTPEPQSRLCDLLQGDQIAWDNFWFGLEEEFRLDIPPSDLRACGTVQDVIEYLDRMMGTNPVHPPAGDAASEAEPASPEPVEEAIAEPPPTKAGRRKPPASPDHK